MFFSTRSASIGVVMSERISADSGTASHFPSEARARISSKLGVVFIVVLSVSCFYI